MYHYMCYHIPEDIAAPQRRDLLALGEHKPGRIKPGRIKKGRFIPPKPKSSYLLLVDTTPLICLWLPPTCTKAVPLLITKKSSPFSPCRLMCLFPQARLASRQSRETGPRPDETSCGPAAGEAERTTTVIVELCHSYTCPCPCPSQFVEHI